MNVSHHGTSNEDILNRTQVRVLQFIQHHNVVEFDVQVLVDGFQSAADRDVILQLDRYGLLGESLEKAINDTS